MLNRRCHRHLLSILVLLAANPVRGAEVLTTNLVDILPYVVEFAEALDLELDDNAATTNSVTRFRPYLGAGSVCGITLEHRWGFQFDVKHSFVAAFTDRERSMNVLWREEEIEPLLLPSKVDEAGALRIAVSYLLKLGYVVDKYPVRKPDVHQWKWQPPGAKEAALLPFFTVNWEWNHREGSYFFTVEIDGLRERVVYFSTMDKSFPVEDMERMLRSGSK